jgi:hypothetical protein
MPDADPKPPDYALLAVQFEQMAARARSQKLAEGYLLIAEGYRVLARNAAVRHDAFSYLPRKPPSA